MKSSHPLTTGSAAAVRLLLSGAPDALLVAGAVLWGIGVWSFEPRAIWFYAGTCCVWLAFAIAAHQKPRGEA